MPELSKPDLPQLVPLLRALHELHVSNLPQVFHGDASSGALLAHLETLHSAGAWILGHWQQDALMGYLLASPERRPRDSFRKGRADVLLDHIYVAPALRGQGAAQSLVDEMEVKMQSEGLTQWRVTHHAFNQRAGRFFERQGALPSVQTMAKSLGR